jgi:ubiquitin-conjugating enzyme E2 C
MSTNATAAIASATEGGKAGVGGNGVSDSASVARRLQSELMGLMTKADAGISAFPDGDNIFNWVGTIEGASGTVRV